MGGWKGGKVLRERGGGTYGYPPHAGDDAKREGSLSQGHCSVSLPPIPGPGGSSLVLAMMTMPPENMPAVPIYTRQPPFSLPQRRNRTYTGDGAPNDKGGRILRNGADQAPDLEYEHCAEEGRLDSEALVDVSEHGLQRRRGEEVRRAIYPVHSLVRVRDFQLQYYLHHPFKQSAIFIKREWKQG